MKWYILDRQQYSENTPEYGHGDYPDFIWYIRAIVEADTKRKAQNQYKKFYLKKNTAGKYNRSFGGQFGLMIFDQEETKTLSFNKVKADERLSLDQQENHNYFLKTFRGE